MLPIDFTQFFDWIAQHPHWAAFAVLLIALAESLAVVGLAVPGAALMIAAGALVGIGVVEFWPITIAATLGAIIGDALSFWLGYHYQERLRAFWPFRNHPAWLAYGERFFRRHGGKSIFFGRFVGPVRPFVPVVAGMLGMRPAAFYLVNMLSALVWAPAYLLPGIAFGASLAVAGEIALRLVVMLFLLVALTWLVLWSIHRLFVVISPRAERMTRAAVAWGRRHPKLNPLIGGLLDPARAETKALLLLALLMIGAVWLFLGVLEDIVTGDPLVRVDQGIYRLLQDLRTPWGDRIMVFITELGDSMVIGLVAAAVLGWLLWLRNWRVAGYWTAAVVFGQITATIMKLAIQRQRPIADVYDGLSTYAFPSGHSVMSTVVYGFLVVLIARRIRPAYRWIAYGLAALLVCAIALSRLYLGAHWLSDVIGGISFGLVWVSLLGIAYYRHATQIALPGSVSWVALLALLFAGGWHVNESYAVDLQRYAPRLVLQHLESSWWWQQGWRELPAYRRDLEGEYEQPLNLQWSGPLTLLREALAARGWRDPVSLSPASALRWLLPAPAIAELPLLPQVHDGRHEALILLRPLERGAGRMTGETEDNRQLVLRLWQSGVVLGPRDEPLWIGYVGSMTQREILLLRLPVTRQDYDASLEKLMQDLDDFERRTVRRASPDADESARWRGRTLLLRGH